MLDCCLQAGLYDKPTVLASLPSTVPTFCDPEGVLRRKRMDDIFGKESQGRLKVVYTALGLTSMECMSVGLSKYDVYQF